MILGQDDFVLVLVLVLVLRLELGRSLSIMRQSIENESEYDDEHKRDCRGSRSLIQLARSSWRSSSLAGRDRPAAARTGSRCAWTGTSSDGPCPRASS